MRQPTVVHSWFFGEIVLGYQFPIYIYSLVREWMLIDHLLSRLVLCFVAGVLGKKGYGSFIFVLLRLVFGGINLDYYFRSSTNLFRKIFVRLFGELCTLCLLVII